ncbi:phage tail domain-containing protein [Latilactobacillus sakei]|uniref:phage tail domain-containing protein n=1 Tax=Latilactobacillus sakei TaxID=1599 RepID=UPI003F532571
MTANSKYGIEFNGLRSDSLGLTVINPKEIGFPSKNKIIQDLPFSNTILDLSEMYGGQSYGERKLKFTFLIIESDRFDKDALYTQWTKTVNWLMGANHKVKLKDDVMSEYYYLGEVQEAPSWDEYVRHGKFTVEFICYPFRIHELAEGSDIWDTFNFELDIAQITEYTVVGSRTVTLYNVGQNQVNPQIVATAPFEITTNGQNYTTPAGTIESPDFVLNQGETSMTIKGNGKISFNWHKELI